MLRSSVYWKYRPRHTHGRQHWCWMWLRGKPMRWDQIDGLGSKYDVGGSCGLAGSICANTRWGFLHSTNHYRSVCPRTGSALLGSLTIHGRSSRRSLARSKRQARPYAALTWGSTGNSILWSGRESSLRLWSCASWLDIGGTSSRPRTQRHAWRGKRIWFEARSGRHASSSKLAQSGIECSVPRPDC